MQHFFRKIALTSVLLFSASLSEAAMWVLPEISPGEACIEPKLLVDGVEEPDLFLPVPVTPVMVFDNDVKSKTVGVVCDGRERDYRVSDLRTSCPGGWEVRVDRVATSDDDASAGSVLDSQTFCAEEDLFVVDLSMKVEPQGVIFEDGKSMHEIMEN